MNPTRYRPIVTWLIIVLNVAAFAFEFSRGSAGAEDIVTRFGVVPSLLLGGQDAGVWITPFTGMFLHGGLLHLIGNLWFLHIFGDNVEDALGHVRFAAFYLLTGLAATFGQVVADPGSAIPMIGASGAISGVLGGYLVLYPRARILALLPVFIFIQFIEVPALLYILFWFAFQLLSSLFAWGNGAEGVAWFAHIGGFVAGWLWLKLLTGRRPERLFRR